MESLRPQFRDYETNLRKDVLDSAAERWNKERAEIIEKLKETDDKALKAYDEIEELKEKIKATENSRKGTLTRYNDLQMKMQNLMAEKEKTDMDNRSLQNKMKVLQMNQEKGEGNDKAKEELLKLNEELTKERKEAIKSKERITQLQKQVDELKNKGGNSAPANENIDDIIKEKDAEIDKFEDLKQRKDNEIASLKKKLEQGGGDSDEILDLKATNKELMEEIAKLKKQLEDNKDESKAPILDNLDDGIEFTDDDKNQMSLFK